MLEKESREEPLGEEQETLELGDQKMQEIEARIIEERKKEAKRKFFEYRENMYRRKKVFEDIIYGPNGLKDYTGAFQMYERAIIGDWKSEEDPLIQRMLREELDKLWLIEDMRQQLEPRFSKHLKQTDRHEAQQALETALNILKYGSEQRKAHQERIKQEGRETSYLYRTNEKAFEWASIYEDTYESLMGEEKIWGQKKKQK